jgi:hypothetical protein
MVLVGINQTNKEKKMKYAIRLTTVREKKVYYLHSSRTGLRARITRTRFFENARKFATEADAQKFINENAIFYLGFDWTVAA